MYKVDRTRRNDVSAKTIFRFGVRLLSGPLSPSFVAKHPEAPERIIDIRGSQTLADLHQIIFKAFDREYPHMYEFQIGGKRPMDKKAVRYGIVQDDEFPDEENAATTPISALKIQPGSIFFYWFDFGDDWWHEVRLLAENPPEKGKGRYPRIVEKKGDSPPQYIDWDMEEEFSALDTSSNAPLCPENEAALQDALRIDEISGLMTDFCESHLNENYSTVCAQLFAATRATWLSWQRGKAQSWAAGLVHAAGIINFLHDPASEPHMKLRDIAQHFGVSPATMENKSREIRDAVNAFPLDPRFCLPERLADSPFVWIHSLNGILVDFRTQSREVQEVALEAGLIPFIPDASEFQAIQKQQKSQNKKNTEKKK